MTRWFIPIYPAGFVGKTICLILAFVMIFLLPGATRSMAEPGQNNGIAIINQPPRDRERRPPFPWEMILGGVAIIAGEAAKNKARGERENHVIPCPRNTYPYRGRCRPIRSGSKSKKKYKAKVRRPSRKCKRGYTYNRRKRRCLRSVIVPTTRPVTRRQAFEYRTNMKSAPVRDYVADEILATFPLFIRPSQDPRSLIHTIAEEHNLTILGEDVNRFLSIRIIRFTTIPVSANPNAPVRIPSLNANMVEAAKKLARDPRILHAQPNYIFQLSGVSRRQYAVNKLQILHAHKLSNGAGVPIALIDGGVDTSHPTLRSMKIKRFDRSARAGNHGTAIASILAAKKQLTGIAPNTTILSFAAFEGNDRGAKKNRKKGQVWKSTTATLLKAVEWSIDNNARVLNLSFSGPRDELLGRALELAFDAGIIAVAAAGNRGPKAKPAYPAAFETVIAVTATDTRDRLYKHANHGQYVEVAAPGVDILVAAPGKSYGLMSGTSMATAFVSGTLSLMMEKYPQLDASQILSLLVITSKDLGRPGRDAAYGHGLINSYAALSGG